MSSENSTSILLFKPGPQLSRKIIFYILSILLLPSMIGFIFVFYNFISIKQIRKRPTNRFIITLLVLNFLQVILELPFRLYFLSENIIPIQHPIFCLIWTWYDNILTTINLLLIAISSIERYIFVFHRSYFQHYSFWSFIISLFICIFLPTIWYTSLIFIYPCENIHTYSRFQCGALCYLFKSSFFSYFEDNIFTILPILIFIFINILLIIRIIIQKKSLVQQQDIRLWFKNIRIISHLLSLGIFSMCIYIPSSILLLISTSFPNSQLQIWANNIRINYFFHLKYLVILACPFMILISQTKMHEQMKRFIYLVRFSLQMRNINQITPYTPTREKETMLNKK